MIIIWILVFIILAMCFALKNNPGIKIIIIVLLIMLLIVINTLEKLILPNNITPESLAIAAIINAVVIVLSVRLVRNKKLSFAFKSTLLIIEGISLSFFLCCMLVASSNRFIFYKQTVKDERTGLIWVRNVNIGKLDWYDATDLVQQLKQNKYAGCSNWRLPTHDELENLNTYAKRLDFDEDRVTKRPSDLYNKLGFQNVKAEAYWSSTTYAFSEYEAWVSSLADGSSEIKIKMGYYYVWPVCSTQ